MKLIAVYIVLVIVGDVASYFIGGLIEDVSPVLGLPAFLAMFFTVFVIGWILAVRMTEPAHSI